METADLIWYVLDPMLRPLAKKQTLRSLIPPLRAYVRYAPWTFGKRGLWFSVVEPYFIWKRHNFIAKTVFGSRLAGTTRELLQQRVYFFGVWEPNLTHWITTRLEPGDTFVDVGANIGYFSLLGSALVGERGHVVAIEASPSTFRALQDNLARNDAKNVRAVQMAVSDRAGSLKFYRGPETHIGLATALHSAASDRNCELEGDVPSARLSEILTSEESRNVRLIKIDVEGMEGSVVAGMESLLRDGRPDFEIVTEVDPDCLAEQGKTADQILAMFAGYGFHAYALANDYESSSYLPPRHYSRPVRLRNAVTSTLDLVFSRTDAETL